MQLKVAGSIWDDMDINGKDCSSVAPPVCKVRIARTTCVWQWATVHCWGLCTVHASQRRATHSMRPYHLSSNGLAECFVCTFKEAMKARKQDCLALTDRLENFLLTYWSSPHVPTGQSPASLFLARSMHTRLDLLWPSVEQCVHEKQSSQRDLHDKCAKARQFAVGTAIMARNHRSSPRWVPGIVLEWLGPLSYQVELDSGLKWRRYVDYLKERLEMPPSGYQLSEGVALEELAAPGNTVAEPQPDLADRLENTDNVPDLQQSRYPQKLRQCPDRFMWADSSC